MDVRQQPDGSLLLTYDSTRWTKWAIGATLLLLVSAAYDYFIKSVTVGYKPDVDGPILRTAETLRVTLGHRPPTMEGSVRMLVSQGRTIDAIKLLRDKEDISLTEAKRRVEQNMESQ